jgi:flagellar M-ring protein FliF
MEWERRVKFLDDWRRLSLRNQIVAVGAALGVVASFMFLVRNATEPQMALLYAGLDASASGEILEALEGMDVKSEPRGDAIYVPENRRDAIRMALAADGLPRQGQAGFELLDDMNAFATTSDMFDAAYWRAKEGELSRTILSTPGVRTARVHIAAPRRSAFARKNSAPRAVVTVGMARGRLDLTQADAMRFVVALAVPDLAPEQVAVIDAANGVVLAPGDPDHAVDLEKSVDDRQRQLESDLVSLLEARVGAGNARVKVSLDLSHQQETFFERTLDPQKRILTDRESSEVSESGTDGAGVVTVASNLPDGDAQSATTPAQSKRSETTESTKFDVSETRRETVTPPGAVRRVQVAVLINAPQQTEGADAAAPPRSPEELQALKKLVAAAIGFDAERGDVVTIESLAFDVPAPLGDEVKSNPIMDFLSANVMGILQLLIPAIVSIVLGLFVLKPLLPSGESAGTPTPAIASAPTLSPAQAALASTPPATPVDQMRKIAAEQQAASTAVLKTWLDERASAA